MEPTSRKASQMPKKLRSSCDACGDAKTKCDRGQPHCTRCVSLNLPCVYGPSRQFGKRPRRTLNTGRNTLSVKPSAGPYAQVPPLQASSGTNHSHQPPPVTTLADVEEMLTVQDYPTLMVNTSGGDNATTPSFGDPGLFLPSLPSSWPQFENYDSNEYMLTTPISDFYDSTIPTPPSAIDKSAAHRCYHEPNEILESLTVKRHSYDSMTKTTLELSQILHANRNAIEAISRFLECHCAKSQPDLAVLHSSLVARVLYFYRQAAGYAAEEFARAEPPPLECPPKRKKESASPVSGTTNVRDSTAMGNTCFLIVEMPFKVGTFNVDTPGVQFAFRNHLIGSEVKKIEPVIDGFLSLAREGEVAEHHRVLYSSVSSWLQQDYLKTGQIFKEAIKKATEKMT